MTALVIILALLGLLACVIGGLMLLVAAFRQSVLWGLAYLFVPFAALFFIIMHWAEAKAGFIVGLIGTVIFAGTLMGSQDVMKGIFTQYALQGMKASGDPKADLTAKIEERRERVIALEAEMAQSAPVLTAQFRALEARRVALKPDDADGIAKFNEEAAAYRELNAKRKRTLEELTAAKQEVSDLLDERSRMVAAKTKQVVMYSTESCGACKMAKQYFAEKGVQYREIDVNQPAGREEFQRLGGHGVPLIMVGDKRVEGFSPQALDAML